MFLISLALILLSCFSGVFSTPVNHLITKLSCSWLEHANVSVEQLNFISGWANFMTAFCSWEGSSVWDQSAQAAPLRLGSIPDKHSLCLRALCLERPARSVFTEVGSRCWHPFSFLHVSLLLVPVLHWLAPVLGYIVFLGSQPLLPKDQFTYLCNGYKDTYLARLFWRLKDRTQGQYS